MNQPIRTLFARIEEFFDQIKLRYKWRYDRWDALNVLLYHGYGTPESVRIFGRVLDDEAIGAGETGTSLWQNIRYTIQRIETDEIPGARVQVRFLGAVVEVETDEGGYFSVDVTPEEPVPEDAAWHDVEVTLLAPRKEGEPPARARGKALVPSATAAFGVISDLDDTVIQTGATDRLKMIRTVLLNNAASRMPFEGVAAFYSALQRGSDDRGINPIFYVSSSPWNLYGLFESFMEAHDIPPGPIFLKDFGFDDDKFFKSGHATHKLERIDALMQTYPNLDFVLLGDSGQKDPEIYREAVRRHPGRIRALFFRDVTDAERDAEVRRIAEELSEAGIPTVLVETTENAAEEAARMGLIRDEDVAQVKAARHREVHNAEETPSVLDRLLG